MNFESYLLQRGKETERKEEMGKKEGKLEGRKMKGSSPAETSCAPGTTYWKGLALQMVTAGTLQYSCLENSMDGRVWWATVHGVAKSQT